MDTGDVHDVQDVRSTDILVVGLALWADERPGAGCRTIGDAILGARIGCCTPTAQVSPQRLRKRLINTEG